MTTGKAKGWKARQRQLDRQRRLSAPQFLGSELSQLQVGHLDLEAGALRVVNGKGGKDRELPIVPRLAAILRPYLATTRPALLKDPTNR